MKYRNTKTGAIIDSSCVISGGDWIKDEPEVEEEVILDEVEDLEDKTEEPEEIIEEEIIEEVVKGKSGKRGK